MQHQETHTLNNQRRQGTVGVSSTDAQTTWIVADAARREWQRLSSGVKAIDRQSWKRWGAGLVLSFIVCAAWTYLVVMVTRQIPDLAAWDERALASLVAWLPMEFADAIMYESPGNLLYLAPLVVVASIISVRAGHTGYAITLIAGYILQRPLVILGWSLWDRVRPSVVAEGIAAPGFHSFPSGHTALSTFVYGFLVYLWIRRARHPAEKLFAAALALIWVAIIAAGRIRLGAHWPSDIVGGFLVAVPWLAACICLLQRLERGRGT
ncbi:MAG: phosphatase PAP2 family protein [Gammaproteobacteria bacterium]|nr:phosphatase PAP2 family protein [Gammaproteobacteria bacterium]